MEGDSTNTLRSYKTDLDSALTGVMPDSWKGHARLAVRESEAVPVDIEEKAIEKASNIADKKGVTPERAANKLIEKLAEKQE